MNPRKFNALRHFVQIRELDSNEFLNLKIMSIRSVRSLVCPLQFKTISRDRFQLNVTQHHTWKCLATDL